MLRYSSRDDRIRPKKGADPLRALVFSAFLMPSKGSDPFFGRNRRGLTLVELLTVIGIIVVLMAVAIPLMKLSQESRPVREGSRGVNAYLAAAQARAAEKGRPVGVWMERAGNNPASSFRLFMADVAPPYIGDTSEARARIGPLEPAPPASPPATGPFYTVTFPPVPNLSGGLPQPRSTALPNLVHVGDVIRFGFQGPYYSIQSIPSTDPKNPVIQINLGNNTEPPTKGYWDTSGSTPKRVFGRAVSYQILRAPRKSRFSSLELPKGASIDLRVSGVGTSFPTPSSFPPGPLLFRPSSGSDTTPVVIMFSPSGRVDHLRVQGQVLVPQETIHLMIGNAELVNSSDRAANLGSEQNEDTEKALTNLWVSIGVETGSVTTSEVVAITPLPSGYTTADLIARVSQSRKIANKKHLMGGG